VGEREVGEVPDRRGEAATIASLDRPGARASILIAGSVEQLGALDRRVVRVRPGVHVGGLGDELGTDESSAVLPTRSTASPEPGRDLGGGLGERDEGVGEERPRPEHGVVDGVVEHGPVRANREPGERASSARMGGIQRGGRPVTSTNVTPAATSRSMTAAARGVTRSWGSSNVPSTSVATSRGACTAPA
jgi:hypothetical protein